MRIRDRIIAAWISHALKGEIKMGKPFPKWVGYLALLAGLVAPGGALFALIPIKFAAIVSSISTVVLAISHSLNGSGGSPVNQ